MKRVMTAREFAETMKVNYWTVSRWLSRKIVPGAVKKTINKMHYWEIPASAVKMQRPKGGRPRKKDAD